MPGERTEQATQHRREKARREGDILHSRELSTAAGTLAGVIALGFLGARTMEAWRSAYAGFLRLGAAARWEPATLEPTLAAVRRLMLTVPLKTLTGFVILTGSLALWPRFIEARFAGLLDLAERLIAAPGTASGFGG